MAPRVLVLTGDYVEDYEITVPAQTLKTIGIEVDVISPGKAYGKAISTAIHDFEVNSQMAE